MAAAAAIMPANPLKRPAERQATLTEFARAVKPKLTKASAGLSSKPTVNGSSSGNGNGSKPASRRVAVHPARPPLSPSHEDDIEFEDGDVSEAELNDGDWIAPNSDAVSVPKTKAQKQAALRRQQQQQQQQQREAAQAIFTPPQPSPSSFASSPPHYTPPPRVQHPRTPEPSPVKAAQQHRTIVGSPLKHSSRPDDSPQPVQMPMLATPPASATFAPTTPESSPTTVLPTPSIVGLAPAAPIIPSSTLRPADFALTVDPMTGKALVHATLQPNRPTMPTLHAAEVASVGRILASREVLVNRFGPEQADVLIARGRRAPSSASSSSSSLALAPLSADPVAERASVQRTLAWAGTVGELESGDEDVPRDETWLTPPASWIRGNEGATDDEDDRPLFGSTVGLGIGAGKSIRGLTAQQRRQAHRDQQPSSLLSPVRPVTPPARRTSKQAHAHFAVPPTPEPAVDDWRTSSSSYRHRTPSLPGNPFAHPILVPGDSHPGYPRYAYDGLEGVALAPAASSSSPAIHGTPSFASSSSAAAWLASPQQPSPSRRSRVVSTNSANLWDYPGLATPAPSAHDFPHDVMATPSRYGAYHRRDSSMATASASASAAASASASSALPPYGLYTPAQSTQLGHGWPTSAGRSSLSGPGGRQRGHSAFWDSMNESSSSHVPDPTESPSHYLATSTHQPHHRRLSSFGHSSSGTGTGPGGPHVHFWDSGPAPPPVHHPHHHHPGVATSMARNSSGLGIVGGDELSDLLAL